MAIWVLSMVFHVLNWPLDPKPMFLGVSLPRAQTFLVWAWQGAMVPDSKVKCVFHGWAYAQEILHLSLSPIYLETGFFPASSIPPSWAPKPVLPQGGPR